MIFQIVQSLSSRYYLTIDHPNDLPLKCPTEGPDADWDMPEYKTQAVYGYGETVCWCFEIIYGDPRR